MNSKILLITIFVAVHVNYICSLNLDIRVCKSDEDVLSNIEELKDETFPIYITDKYEENYLNNEGMDVLIPFYENNNQISHLLIVLAGSCEATRNVLCGHTVEKEYPVILYFKEGQLNRRRWETFTRAELTSSLDVVRNYQPKFKAEFNLNNQIRDSIKEIKTAREVSEAMAYKRENQLAIPRNTLPPRNTIPPLSQRWARPPANQSFVTGATNQMPTMTWPRVNVRPPPYRQTDFARTMRDPSVGTSSTQPDTREKAVWSISNFSAPRATRTSSPPTPVGGVRTIRMETERFEKEPVTPQQNEIVTRDLLGTVGQNQQEVGSDSTPTQYNQYNQLIDEEKLGKRLKLYKGFSGSRSSSSSST